jgi:SAM-dependent methyltransferase
MSTSTVASQLPTPDALPSPLVYPLSDVEGLIQLYAATLGWSPEAVCQRLHHDELSVGKIYLDEFAATGIEPYTWSEGMARFYEETKSILLGSVIWNRCPEKLRMREWIGRFLASQPNSPLDVLTIGDGAGFDSLYLAKCGHRVTYSEVSPCACDFAERLFQKCDVNVQVLREIAEIKSDSYDAISCLDVLEHVPDPREVVASLSRYLRPGGLLIVHAPFYYLSHMMPTHLKSNRKYAGDLRKLYRPFGFRMVDGRTLWDPIVLQKTDGTRPLSLAPLTRRIGLRLSGSLLAVGRYWSGIHNWCGDRTIGNINAEWISELERSPYFHPYTELSPS